jgi:hypothetical protein
MRGPFSKRSQGVVEAAPNIVNALALALEAALKVSSF